jgi:ACT domain-containing protein
VNETAQERTLSERQQKAIAVVLAARSIAEGVKKAKVSRTQFYEWLRDSAFKEEFERQRQELIDLALHELRVSAGEAVEVLRALLKSEQDGVKLRTATAILDHIGKFIELENIEKRLSEIERRLESGKN